MLLIQHLDPEGFVQVKPWPAVEGKKCHEEKNPQYRK